MHPASKNKWLVFIAVATGVFLATIDSSIVNIALPTLTKYFNAPFSTVEWVVLAYLITATSLMLGVGRLADMHGSKPYYLAGFIVFLAGSVACGQATSIGMLIAARVIQAIGASMMMALGSAIVTDAFPPSERGKALGFVGVIVSIGVIIGPTLGGFLITKLSWRWLFLVNVPIGLIGIILVAAFVRQNRPKGAESFDWAGMSILFIALLTVSLALTMGTSEGWTSPMILTLLSVGLIAILVFICIEKHVRHPLIDLSLFSNQLFSINILTSFLLFICNAGIILIAPFYLQEVLQFDAQKAGMLMAAMPIIVGIVAPIAGNLSDKMGPRLLTAIGLFIIMLSYLWISTVQATTSEIGYVLRFIPLGIGVGLFQSPNNSAVMGSIARERLSIASGLLSVTRTLGQTTGVALLGALWSSLTAIGIQRNLSENMAKLEGFRMVLYTTAGILAVGFAFSLWAFFKERRLKTEN